MHGIDVGTGDGNVWTTLKSRTLCVRWRFRDVTSVEQNLLRWVRSKKGKIGKHVKIASGDRGRGLFTSKAVKHGDFMYEVCTIPLVQPHHLRQCLPLPRRTHSRTHTFHNPPHNPPATKGPRDHLDRNIDD